MINIPICIVSKIWRIIGPILAVDRGVPVFNAFILGERVNSRTYDCEIWLQETRNIALSYDVKSISIRAYLYYVRSLQTARTNCN